MVIDWGLAGQIGYVGFGMVFALLIVLAVIVVLVGLVVTRAGIGKSESGDQKEGG